MRTTKIIDLVNEKFDTPILDTPILDEFITLWISLFAHSSLAKVEWRAKSGVLVKICSVTQGVARWWSRFFIRHFFKFYFWGCLPCKKKQRHHLQLLSDKYEI